MPGRIRIAAVLAALLVVGLAATARGSTGDPLFLGQTNTSAAETTLDGRFNLVGDFVQTNGILQTDGAVLSQGGLTTGGWVYSQNGYTFGEGSSQIGTISIRPGKTCASALAFPVTNPIDNGGSRPVLFTTLMGFHPGVSLLGAQVTAGTLPDSVTVRVCINHVVPTDTTSVDYVIFDLDNQP
jgi:hypothetical protein